MEYHYNLVDEAWVPCTDLQGDFKLRSLRETLLLAHELREIHAELPPMTASILVLLLAILYRSLHPADEDEWVTCWERGAFDPQTINRYLEQWRDRFDLFDETHPFYQDPLIGKRQKDIEKLKGNSIEPKDINGLILHSSSGDTATLFDHSTDAQSLAFSPAQMARHLLMFQSFSLGGMTSASISADKFYTDSPHARGVALFLRGKNLFQTLMLNLIASNNLSDPLSGKGADRPAWEMDDPLKDERQIPLGLTDFLTWQSRRLLLIPSNQSELLKVKQLYSAPGLVLSTEFENPFFSTYSVEISKGKFEKKLLRFSGEKALWRDSQTILGDFRSKRTPPAALTWINSLLYYGLLDSRINILAYGICSSPGKKKAFFYREESFSYPIEFLKNHNLLDKLTRHLYMAGQVKSLLWGSLSKLAALILSTESDFGEGKKANPEDIKTLINHWGAEAFFWKELEIPFYHLVNAMPKDPQKAEAGWIEAQRKTAISAFNQAEIMSGLNIRVLKASSKARGQLLGSLKKELVSEEKEEK